MREDFYLREYLRHCLPETDEDGDLGCDGCPYEGKCTETVSVPAIAIEELRRMLTRKKREQKIPDGMDARGIMEVIEDARKQKSMSMTAVSVKAGRDEGHFNHVKQRVMKSGRPSALDTVCRFADAVDVDIVAIRRENR